MSDSFYCNRCGAVNLYGQKQCYYCGQPFYYNCPRCNAFVDNTFADCPNCGMGLAWPGQQAAGAPVRSQADGYEHYKPEKRSNPLLRAVLALVGVVVVAAVGIIAFNVLGSLSIGQTTPAPSLNSPPATSTPPASAPSLNPPPAPSTPPASTPSLNPPPAPSTPPASAPYATDNTFERKSHYTTDNSFEGK